MNVVNLLKSYDIKNHKYFMKESRGRILDVGISVMFLFDICTYLQNRIVFVISCSQFAPM